MTLINTESIAAIESLHWPLPINQVRSAHGGDLCADGGVWISAGEANPYEKSFPYALLQLATCSRSCS